VGALSGAARHGEVMADHATLTLTGGDLVAGRAVTLPDGKPHVVAFRAFDANANVGSAQVAVNGK
jgi:hypothetical protein